MPKTEKPKSTTTTTTKAAKTEAALVEEEEDEDVLTPEDYVEQEIEEEATDDDDVITEPKTTTTTMPTTEKEPTTEEIATTVTTHRLIVGTPPETSITAEYSIDEQYDDYEKVDDESNVNFDTAEAQQEALVQIKRSEGFWAFLSCTVLVVGKFYNSIFNDSTVNLKCSPWPCTNHNCVDESTRATCATMIIGPRMISPFQLEVS